EHAGWRYVVDGGCGVVANGPFRIAAHQPHGTGTLGCWLVRHQLRDACDRPGHATDAGACMASSDPPAFDRRHDVRLDLARTAYRPDRFLPAHDPRQRRLRRPTPAWRQGLAAPTNRRDARGGWRSSRPRDSVWDAHHLARNIDGRVHDMRRRNFLAGLASSMLMAGGLRVARAIEPIQRVGGPQFQFSLAAYSYRDLLQRAKERLTLSDFVRDCAAMQLEGVELTSYYFPQPVTAEYLVQLKGECFRLGLDVSGTAVGNDFGVPAGPAREKQIADVKKW